MARYLRTRIEGCRSELGHIRAELSAVAEVLPEIREPLAAAAAALAVALEAPPGPTDATALRDGALAARNHLRSVPCAKPWLHRLGALIPDLAKGATAPMLRLVH